MPVSNSLSNKVARNPLRFGMIAGFLGVPLLWMAGDSLALLAQGYRPLPIEMFWSYEASGALIGAFLGGQGARIWSKWRADRVAEARYLALVTGGLGVAVYVGQAALYAGTSPYFFPALIAGVLNLVIQHHLPFLLCLLLVCFGLLGPKQ